MAKQLSKKTNATPECFVIMPIADPDGYDTGHFRKVYEDIFQPACKTAGFAPVRADEVTQTNLIHLDILQRLVDTPMAICDLSSRNPNVLFELGLRQAFDKPTVLVQETGTPRIFDIAPLRYTEYRRELKYREVIADQKAVATALHSTQAAADSGEGVNSIVSILSIAGPAALKESSDKDATKMFRILQAEMSELRREVRHTRDQSEFRFFPREVERIREMLTHAHRLLEEAEVLDPSENADEIVTSANRVREIVLRVIEDPAMPQKYRCDAANLFSKATEIEQNVVSMSDGKN